MKTIFIVILCLPVLLGTAFCQERDAGEIVQASFDYYRGETSTSRVEMTVHRPDWERSFIIDVWTEGMDESLFRVLAPPKDRGNGTLKKGREMWMYNPKVNRVIKVPPSMMSQAWMGSDFSNNDLAKSDALLEYYTHKMVGTDTHEGKKVYIIESLPKPRAPVVWGKQVLRIREDNIFLEEAFYDEDMIPVKVMAAHDIRMLGGKLFPALWSMKKADQEDEYTQLKYLELEFDVDIQGDTFTLSNLRSPVRR